MSALGIYAIFFIDPFYPWLMILAVSLTSMIVAAKG